MLDSLHQDISKETFRKVQRLEKIHEVNIEQIQLGLLSVHASWSAYSILHGKKILNLIDQLKPKLLEVIVIDIDLLKKKEQIQYFGQQCQGYFESVWIENGKVIYKYMDNNISTEINSFLGFINDNLSRQK